MKNRSADYRMIVKELSTKGEKIVWALECYPETRQFSCFSNNQTMYIKFNAETTEQEAIEISRLLNDHISEFVII